LAERSTVHRRAGAKSIMKNCGPAALMRDICAVTVTSFGAKCSRATTTMSCFPGEPMPGPRCVRIPDRRRPCSEQRDALETALANIAHLRDLQIGRPNAHGVNVTAGLRRETGERQYSVGPSFTSGATALQFATPVGPSISGTFLAIKTIHKLHRNLRVRLIVGEDELGSAAR